MKKTKLIFSVILLVSCTINAGDAEGKKTKKNVLSETLAKSKGGKVAQRSPASSAVKIGKEKGELAEALKRSQKPYDIDPNMASAIAASLADSSSEPSAGGGQAAQSLRAMSEDDQLEAALLASQNPYDIDPDMAKAMANSLADLADDEAADLQIEAQASQGNFLQELSQPQILLVDGKQYTIRQIRAILQSKVSGRLEQERPDNTCFAQATKNTIAILTRNKSQEDSFLAPLVILKEARIILRFINQSLEDTEPILGDNVTRQDPSDGNWDDVSVEFGSKMIAENYDRLPLVVICDAGLQSLIRPKSPAEKQDELTALRENIGQLFLRKTKFQAIL